MNAYGQIAALDGEIKKIQKESEEYIQKLDIPIPKELITRQLQEKAQIVAEIMIAAGVQTAAGSLLQSGPVDGVGHVILTEDEVALSALEQRLGMQQGEDFATRLDRELGMRLAKEGQAEGVESPSKKGPAPSGYDSLDDDIQGDESNDG